MGVTSSLLVIGDWLFMEQVLKIIIAPLKTVIIVIVILIVLFSLDYHHHIRPGLPS